MIKSRRMIWARHVAHMEGRDMHTSETQKKKPLGVEGVGSFPGRGKIFLFSTASRPALGPTQPPGALSLRIKRQGREADHHLHLVPRSRMVELIRSLPHMSSWHDS
jgi:hypothetical protein